MTFSYGEQKKPDYDNIAHLYDQTRGWPKEVARQIGFGLYTMLTEASGAIEPLVLEVGVGTGRVAVPLAAHGARVYGVDVSGEMLRVMAANSAHLASVGFPQRIGAGMADAHNLPFPADVFHAGMFVHVLHRVGDWRHAIVELQRVVLPDGALVFGIDETGPNDATWIDKCWREIVAEEGVKPAEEGPERISTTLEAVSALRGEGYSIGDHVLARWISCRTPAQIIANYRQRAFPSTWGEISDDMMAHATARLENEVARHFGSLDIELEREQYFRVIVARR